jgi:hypothetical protein
VAALDEPEAPGAPGDLGDLPRVQVAPLLAVELLRLGEEQGLARKVDAVPEHVRRAADVGLAVHEPLDLEPARSEWHRAVEDGDASRAAAVELAREREHGAPAERDHDRSRLQALERHLARPVERRLALEEADLGLRKRVLDERQRLDGPEQQDVLVLAREQQPRPGGAALAVIGPLHLVEHEHLAVQRRHFRRAADDRRALVDPLLAGDEPDRLGAELRGEAPVRLLGEHAQRRREDASAGVGEELERRVRLAGVGRPDVRDHRLRLDPPVGEDDLRLGDAEVRLAPLVPLRPAGALLAAAVLPPGRHVRLAGSAEA